MTNTPIQIFLAGPWDYFIGNSNGRGLIRIETSHSAPFPGVHIASMPRGEQSEWNARLIAAAPYLYSYVKEIADKPLSSERIGFSTSSDEDELWDEYIIDARRVINIVEGK